MIISKARNLFGIMMLLGSNVVLAIPAGSQEVAPDTIASCSTQADSWMFLMPIAAQANTSLNGGTVTDVAQDGFTAVGLSYLTGVLHEAELNAWLDSGICMVGRLWPTRTVQDSQDLNYHGTVGSLIRATNEKEVLCSEVIDQFGATTGFEIADPPTNNYCKVEEINHASDAQMDAWVEQVEQMIIDTVADPLLNNRTIAWYMGPEEPRPYDREIELLERIYAAVQQYDPLDRPAWTYNPQHTSALRLELLAPSLDMFSVGAYPNNAYNMHQRIQVVHAMKQMNLANQNLGLYSAGSSKRLLPVLEMYEVVEPGVPTPPEGCIPDRPADALQVSRFVRHDAYAAFANGADGIIVWSLGAREGFSNYANYYSAWAQFGQETISHGLRDVFAKGNVQRKPFVKILSEKKHIDFIWCIHDTKTASYKPISSRHWRYQGQNYVLLVNSSEETVELAIRNIPSVAYEDILNSVYYAAHDDELNLRLPALGVALLVSVD